MLHRTLEFVTVCRPYDIFTLELFTRALPEDWRRSDEVNPPGAALGLTSSVSKRNKRCRTPNIIVAV